MKLQVFCLSLLVTLGLQLGIGQAATAAPYSYPFNCNRAGTPCTGTTTTCNPDGTCSSCDPTTNHGHDCSFAECTRDPCTGEGQLCSGADCLCDEGYVDVAGTCEKRLQVTECTDTSMTMAIRPYGDPSAGKIYIEGHYGDSKCEFNCPATVCTLGPVLFTDCGTASDVNGDGTLRCFDVHIQYDENVQLSDTIAELCCTAAKADAETAAEPAILTMKPLDATVVKKAASSASTVSGVEVSLLSAGDAPLLSTTPITLGTEIKIYTKLTPAKFVDVLVTKIMVSGGSSTVVLVGEDPAGAATPGCINEKYASNIVSFTKATGSTVTITLLIKLFGLTGSDSINIDVTFIPCEVSGGVCAPKGTCTAKDSSGSAFPTDGFGRRKRRQSPNEERLNVTMLVQSLYPVTASNKYGTKLVSVDDACLQKMVFIIPLVVLVALLLLSVGMSLFFCLRASRRGPNNEGSTNMAYKS